MDSIQTMPDDAARRPLATPLAAGTASYTFDAARPARPARALADLAEGFGSWRLAAALAWLDLRNRYRGSVLGPFWVTLSTCVMLVGLGFLYGQLFNLPLAEYIPHLAVSLVVWNAISSAASDGCTAMTGSAGIVRQLRVPFTVHALRCAIRTGIVTAHNLPLIILTVLAFGIRPGWGVLLVVPGLALLAVNTIAACFLLGMICARFRDIGQIVASVMQLAFFMTPVIWKPEMVGGRVAFLAFNPFYPLLEVVRGPLLEGGAPPGIWIAAVLVTLAHAAVAFAFFVRFRGRLAFWV